MVLIVTWAHAALVDLYALRDPALADRPLAGTPLAPAAVLAVYVWLVFAALPRFMRDRPAYDMRRFMLVYNALQVAANAYMTLWVRVLSGRRRHNARGQLNKHFCLGSGIIISASTMRGRICNGCIACQRCRRTRSARTCTI